MSFVENNNFIINDLNIIIKYLTINENKCVMPTFAKRNNLD